MLIFSSHVDQGISGSSTLQASHVKPCLFFRVISSVLRLTCLSVFKGARRRTFFFTFRFFIYLVSLPVRTADKLTAFMSRISCNMEASAPWNSQGLSRLVHGLLYL